MCIRDSLNVDEYGFSTAMIRDDHMVVVFEQDVYKRQGYAQRQIIYDLRFRNTCGCF